jgi:hypothetical protein
MVARLAPDSRPTYWASMAPPCTGVFLPCWVDTAPPQPLAHADEEPHDASPWWRYRRLWESVAAAPDPGAAVERVRAAWRPLEEYIEAQLAALGSETSPEARRGVSEDAWAGAARILSRLEEERAASRSAEALATPG